MTLPLSLRAAVHGNELEQGHKLPVMPVSVPVKTSLKDTRCRSGEMAATKKSQDWANMRWVSDSCSLATGLHATRQMDALSSGERQVVEATKHLLFKIPVPSA